MQALVLAAGKGTRMRSERPKVLHEILGQPMLAYVLETLASLGVRKPVVVLGSGAKQVRSFIEDWKKDSMTVPGQPSICHSGLDSRRLPDPESSAPNPGSRVKPGMTANGGVREDPVIVLQREQRGTGHAVMVAERAIGKTEDLLIWPGDMPLLKRETMTRFIAAHRKSKAAVSVLSGVQPEPKGYGRILRAAGKFYGIREELDATESERRIQEVNTGIYLFDTEKLFGALKKIRPVNAKNEYYLTDTIEILNRENIPMEAFPFALPNEALGINSQQDLSVAVQVIKNREVLAHQERGVTFVAPEQTFVAPGVKIGPDTTVYPWCFIETDVVIGKGCQIGPFAKIRKGTRIGDESVIGSFVELNRSKIGRKVLAKHLTYLGDAVIGDETNVGAGTITANYDGKKKHPTRIGKKVFIGSNTVLVAPVVVEDGAKTGAGAVVTAKTHIRKGDVFVGVPAKSLKSRNSKNQKRK